MYIRTAKIIWAVDLRSIAVQDLLMEYIAGCRNLRMLTAQACGVSGTSRYLEVKYRQL